MKPSGAGPAEEQSAIQTESLVRRFGRVEALAGVSLSVRQGEFFSLLGPSGCGKTTLLRIIAGLDMPDSGRVRVGGRDAAGIPAHKRPVNTVFQSYALFPHLSVWDNVAFGLRMQKVAASQIQARVTRVMDLVQITELAARRPAQLSGGQKQRVALARAVVNEPAVLLLDEPLGALDLKLRKQLQGELHQLQRRLGITFIYVTHDQEEALVMSDRVAVMNQGEIVQMDAPQALYERPRTRFVAQFLGLCNLLPGKLEAVTGSIAAVRTAIGLLSVVQQSGPKPKVGDSITLAVRPEKLAVCGPDIGGGANEVQARVEDLVYSGAETQYRLRVGDCVLTAAVLNGSNKHFAVGDAVVCRLPEHSLIILED